MTKARGKSLIRLWTEVELLRGARRGLTIVQLVERTGGSRASIYRDINVLQSAGVPIDKVCVAGEMRYMLALGHEPSRAGTPMQLVALLTARRGIAAVEGTRVMAELDELIRSLGCSPAPSLPVHVSSSQALAPDRLRVLDQALEQKKRVRIRYRGARDAKPTWRNVEPVEVRVLVGLGVAADVLGLCVQQSHPSLTAAAPLKRGNAADQRRV